MRTLLISFAHVFLICLFTYFILYICTDMKQKRSLNVGNKNVQNDDDIDCQTKIKTTRYVTENCSEKFCYRHLTDYALKHITVGNENECKFKNVLKYKCFSRCGGLGDRIRGIMSSFLLAILTKRAFVIDMQQPCGLDSILNYRVYDWSICKTYATSNNLTKIVHITKSMHNVVPDISSIDFDNNWTENVIEVATRIYAIDAIKKHRYANERLQWLSCLTNEDVAHMLINTLFREGNALLKSKHQLLQTIGNSKKLVCAHVRIGQNPSNPKDSLSPYRIDNQQINAILSFLKGYALVNRYYLYLASDSDNIKELAGNIPNMHVLNRSIVHIDRPAQGRFSLEVCDGLFTVLLEIYILASCDILLLTRSNFGAIAAYTRGISKGLYMFNHKNNKNKNGIYKINLADIQNVFDFH